MRGDVCPKSLLLGGAILILMLVYTGIYSYDLPTWMMEVAPILIALPVLAFTRRAFPLTSLLYAVIFVHAIVLMIGGMYTYARVPLGYEIAQWFHLERNPYDKIGHFMQGFGPALIAREILIRGNYVRGAKMSVFVVLSIVLAISASYELIEWGAALAMGQGADEFLGTQGYVWDTQSDMFFALIGAIVAVAFFSRWHDKMIEKMEHDENPR